MIIYEVHIRQKSHQTKHTHRCPIVCNERIVQSQFLVVCGGEVGIVVPSHEVVVALHVEVQVRLEHPLAHPLRAELVEGHQCLLPELKLVVLLSDNGDNEWMQIQSFRLLNMNWQSERVGRVCVLSREAVLGGSGRHAQEERTICPSNYPTVRGGSASEGVSR